MPEPATLISILVVDDNPRSVELLTAALAQPDVRIFSTTSSEEGLELAFQHHPEIVITDLVMPGLNGLELLDRLIEFDPGIDVILMTAHYSTESAVDAIRRGACDYLNKPVSIQTLRSRIARLLEEKRRHRRALQLEDELTSSWQFEGIVGRSPVMLALFDRIRRIAPHFRTVLIAGETGTGKDLVARALHRLSPVAQGNFVALNCSAVVETLFESELFGHTKGSFTGATHDKAGLIEHAHGGVLFLDEIGDMPLSMQAKLLRVLQNQEVQRVGSLSTRRVDVRVVAATHQDLRRLIPEKAFREDLFYRLAMVELKVPPLRERPEDIQLLARLFLQRFAALYNKPVRRITQRAQIALSRHSWPGNVRQLENAIGHACMMATGDSIDYQDLPFVEDPVSLQHEVENRTDHLAGSSLEAHERAVVAAALEQSGGNQSEAARHLRIGRDALRYKMKKFGLL